MLSKFLFASFVALGVSSHAMAKTYTCSNVGGTEEWRIRIDLTKQVASFFDNDSTVTVPQVRVSFLESLPSQKVYEFEGPDTAAGRGATLSIWFNETRRTASVTLKSRARTERLEALEGCVSNE